MPGTEDQIDQAAARFHRSRLPSTIVGAVSVPLAVAVVVWALRSPSDARSIAALASCTTSAGIALYALMCWRWADRDRYERAIRRQRQWQRKHPGVYHDPSPTRTCPRCGLPMDRLAGGAFYTGPPSPRELCHRCLHADDHE